jgi:hypothetical protein
VIKDALYHDRPRRGEPIRPNTPCTEPTGRSCGDPHRMGALMDSVRLKRAEKASPSSWCFGCSSPGIPSIISSWEDDHPGADSAVLHRRLFLSVWALHGTRTLFARARRRGGESGAADAGAGGNEIFSDCFPDPAVSCTPGCSTAGYSFPPSCSWSDGRSWWSGRVGEDRDRGGVSAAFMYVLFARLLKVFLRPDPGGRRGRGMESSPVCSTASPSPSRPSTFVRLPRRGGGTAIGVLPGWGPPRRSPCSCPPSTSYRSR